VVKIPFKNPVFWIVIRILMSIAHPQKMTDDLSITSRVIVGKIRAIPPSRSGKNFFKN